MQKTPEVLIIGAGPTGLMLACQLTIFNIPFIIIDANKDHTTQSRAIGIHAASMEIFSQMGIADKFLNQGKQVKAINAYVKGKSKHIPLSQFGQGLTEFPFLLALEQSKTEKLLVEFLEDHGQKVMWNTELIDFTQTDKVVQARVKHTDGIEEVINASWLVGADGAKSLVRHILDLPFGGKTYPLDLFVLDCKIDWQLKNDELHMAFSDYSFALFFPLPEDTCRVVGLVPDEFSDKEDITFEDVNKNFAERMQMKVKLYDPKWISAYHSHHRYVSEFKKGRCFLAGDAAHIHSPVGAQGMNTGLEDAYNLAWKLALVTKNYAKENLLETYNEERLPFARQLVKTTDRAFNLVASKSRFMVFVRENIAPFIIGVLSKIKFLTKIAFINISQIGITYSKSLLVNNASWGSFSSKSPRPGQRVPFIEFGDEGKTINAQNLISGFKMHLFIFSGANNTVKKTIIEITEKYNAVVSIKYIGLSQQTKSLYMALGIKGEGCYLIRHDLYIAYRSNGFNEQHLKNYLQTFLK